MSAKKKDIGLITYHLRFRSSVIRNIGDGVGIGDQNRSIGNIDGTRLCG